MSLKKQEVTTLKEKTAVDKLRDQFDVERIGLTKALNEATDAETKLRLQAKGGAFKPPLSPITVLSLKLREYASLRSLQ